MSTRKASLIFALISIACSVTMIVFIVTGKLRGPSPLRDVPAFAQGDDIIHSLKDNHSKNGLDKKRRQGLVVPNALVYEIVEGEPVSTQKVIPDYTKCEVLKEFPHKEGKFVLISVPSYQNGYFIVSDKNIFVLD